MAIFSMQYCAKDVFKDGKPRTLDTEAKQKIEYNQSNILNTVLFIW